MRETFTPVEPRLVYCMLSLRSQFLADLACELLLTPTGIFLRDGSVRQISGRICFCGRNVSRAVRNRRQRCLRKWPGNQGTGADPYMRSNQALVAPAQAFYLPHACARPDHAGQPDSCGKSAYRLWLPDQSGQEQCVQPATPASDRERESSSPCLLRPWRDRSC